MTVAGQDPRDVVHDLVAGVTPLDDHEVQDRAATLEWIRSGAPLFRIARPATPDKHLCVYFALFDDARRSVLLVDHVKAGLWLFPGGHVDDGEDPRTTVLREAAEELRIDGEFHSRFGDEPLFLTVTKTRGEHSHTDVSFWFVLAADQDMQIVADPREANGVRWFALDDPAEWAHDRFDPHMKRFRDKLLARLGTPALVG
ncbi:NUDIX hydrolase [Amycolatopsis thailandensis]|jgi:8-oxo-dGTP diphosphatase|uniref:NUDIX hydrolase n=1 Tax=Amycolatopsis thailandensis TaxID=589330 RepID=UPI00364BE3AC